MVTEFVIPEVLQARLRRSVLAAGVEPFVLHLTSHGYAPRTIGVYVDAIAHLARWMRRARASFARLDERLIERFIGQHLPRCRCPEPCCRVTSNVRAAGRRFIKVSRQAGLLRASVHGAPAAPELAAFRDYLSASRGLAESTQRARLRIIADFFRWRFGRKAPRPAQLTVSDVHRFVTAHCVGAAAGDAAVTACALRSYLRFRALAGQAVAALLAAVPTVAQWPLERLPQVLDDTLIQAIEQTFDVSTAGGARDRAMFRLMLDLGLRVSEVARIKLQDIDWRRGSCTSPPASPAAWTRCRSVETWRRRSSSTCAWLARRPRFARCSFARPHRSISRSSSMRCGPPCDKPIGAAAILSFALGRTCCATQLPVACCAPALP